MSNELPRCKGCGQSIRGRPEWISGDAFHYGCGFGESPRPATQLTEQRIRKIVREELAQITLPK